LVLVGSVVSVTHSRRFLCDLLSK